MRNASYNLVGETSILLNEKILELKHCQEEKEEILKTINDLKSKNLLEQNFMTIKKRMDANLEHFKTVVEQIEAINKNISVV